MICYQLIVNYGDVGIDDVAVDSAISDQLLDAVAAEAVALAAHQQWLVGVQARAPIVGVKGELTAVEEQQVVWAQ